MSHATLDGRAQPDATLQEQSLYRRVAWRLVPFLCLCYLMSYLDRINVGFARLTMESDLGFSASIYGFGAGLFFVGYILFEVPSNLILARVGAKLWIARIMVTWGIISGMTMLVTEPWHFYTLRFLLGFAEAGFLPGVLYYLTCWFPSYRRGKVMALFIIGLPLSSVIGGPLSGGIMHFFDGSYGLAGWQWLFLLEALPTVVLGVVTLFWLPNGISDARWLDAEQKALLQRRLKDDNDELGEGKHSFKDAFLSLRVWLLGGIDFSILLSAYALGFWLPSFIRDTGVSDTFHIGVLTAIPSIAGVLGMLAIGFSSDHFRERRWHIIVPFIIGAFSMFASTFFTHQLVATVALFSLASLAIFGAIPVFFSLPGTFLKGTAAATGFALAISVANIAGLISNSLMGLMLDLTGSARFAIWFFAACLLLSCLIVLWLPPKLVNR